jgi:hypothetical protein
MTEQTKIVKGGFRATLALIISIIALIVSIVTYSSLSRDEGLNSQIKNLQATIERMKTESAGQLNRLRNETAQTLEKMSNALRIEEGAKNTTGETNKEATK